MYHQYFTKSEFSAGAWKC